MPWSLKQTILTVGCWLAILFIIHLLKSQTTDRWFKGWLVLAQFVFITESVVAIVSYVVWKTLSNLPAILSDSQRTSGRFQRPHRNSDAQHSHQNKEQYYIKPDSEADNVNPRQWTIWHYILAACLCMSHMSYFTVLFLIGDEPYWFAFLCYTCLGLEVQCFTCIVLIKCFSLALKYGKSALSPRFHNHNVDISRKTKVVILIVYVLVAGTVGLYTASQPPPVKRVAIPVRDLPENLTGLRIIQLSDIHLGPTVGYSKLRMIMNIVGKEDPDLLVITGDLVDGSVAMLKRAAQPLKSFNPKYGKLFVTGNHEYYTIDVENWLDFMRSLNFNVLHNSNVKIPQGESSGQSQICFCGTDDIQAGKMGYGDGHGFDIKKAVKGCDESLPVILLAHQPIAAKKALDSGVRLDLILSGHTHGGQIFPMMFLSYFLQPFYVGLYKIEGRDSHVYVSTGTQFWGIPMRIGTSMEITAITLRRL